MFGRLRPAHVANNSYITVEYTSGSSDSEDNLQIHTPPTVLIRTKLLILDYKQFKAARLIQKIIRGWLARCWMKRRNNAAKVIQRAWWRYIGKRYRSSLAQEMLQTFIVGTFNNSSLKIQALFRGWHSRRHIYNMLHLNMIQKQALEEILTNMVHKMRKINQRNELPGVLTFSDNSIRVEKFLTTLTYRIYNWYVANDMNSLRAMREERRIDFLNSAHYTKIPFMSVIENCSKVVSPEMFERAGKTYTIKDFEVAEAFTAGVDPRTAQNNKRLILIKKTQLEKRMNEKKLFCSDVFKGMSRWSIFRNGNLQCEASLDDSTIGEFLAEVKQYLLDNNLMEDCYCQRDTKPVGYFPDVQL